MPIEALTDENQDIIDLWRMKPAGVLSADTAGVLSADTAGVLSADTAGVLSADTAGVLSADTAEETMYGVSTFSDSEDTDESEDIDTKPATRSKTRRITEENTKKKKQSASFEPQNEKTDDLLANQIVTFVETLNNKTKKFQSFHEKLQQIIRQNKIYFDGFLLKRQMQKIQTNSQNFEFIYHSKD